jgi:ribosomal protein S18 acetylase RimI-like enzyme
MKVAYITTYDPFDRAHWSGLGHAFMQALVDAGANVKPLGPLSTDRAMVGRLKGAFYRRALGKSYEYDRERIPCLGYARQAMAKLARGEYDVVLSPGAIPVSRLDCAQPIAIWADATFAGYVEHYGLADRLARETLCAGEATERAAYARASLLIFASQWAADSAAKTYGVDPAKILVVPFGANFLHPPDRDAAMRGVDARPNDRCELISIGVDWARKGMPRAVALARALNERGLPTRLTIIGARPPAGERLPDFVELAGFIDKRTPDGEAHLGALLSRSHFHVLFTKAEAFGIVFAEANAWAVPNIASDVGGIATVVVEGRGGRRFAPDAEINVVADFVASHVVDKLAYALLARAARDECERRLNWSVSGAIAKGALEALCDRAKHVRAA